MPTASSIDLPLPADMLANLGPQRTRICVSADAFERLQNRAARDSHTRQQLDAVRRRADEMLDQPPSEHVLRDGKRLLFVSRETLDRVWYCGLMHRLSGEAKYLQRIWMDMEAVAAFPDWNPAHFLDTAELAHACATAYDWLHDDWAESQRQTIREAIMQHALVLAIDAYEQPNDGGTPGHRPSNWWTRTHHNWNQVCNGGIAMAAIAIAEHVPELAARLVHHAVQCLPRAMAAYKPDGGYPEGPTYWSYGTRYNVYLLATLQTALGTDFGLSDLPGFDRTLAFPIHMAGPIGKWFNFADAPETVGSDGCIIWLANRFNRPAAYRFHHQCGEAKPLAMLWHDDDLASRTNDTLPRQALFRNVNVMSARSDWDDPAALFVGFKGGNNAFNHNMLDLGSFVFDALGERWAVDLGTDNYNMPGYFEAGEGGQRWTYYRMRAESHNTLVINPTAEADQHPLAVAELGELVTSDDAIETTADLSDAYARDAQRVRRRLRFEPAAQRVTFEDDITLRHHAEILWIMHTTAAVTLEQNEDTAGVLLEQNGKRLRVACKSTPAAVVEVTDAQPLPTSPNPAEQSSNDGVRRLIFRLSAQEHANIKVTLTAARA